MIIKDCLIAGIRNASNASALSKTVLSLVLLSSVFFLVSFTTNSWLTSEEVTALYNTRSQGLWEYCSELNSANCCGKLDDIVGSFHHVIPAFVYATRAFMCIAMIFLAALILITFLAVFVCNPYGDAENLGHIWSVICLIIIVVSQLISVSVYGGSYPNHDWTNQYSISWSFGLCILSMLMFAITLFLTCFTMLT